MFSSLNVFSTHFKRTRWKRNVPILLGLVFLCVFLPWKYYMYREAIKQHHRDMYHPILPLVERRNMRGGISDIKKVEENLPGLEISAHIPLEPHASQSPRNLEFNFFNYVEHRYVTCHKTRRLGTQHEGGWSACLSPPFEFKQPCLVYSFGIGNDWRFEDEMGDQFHCQVLAFDHSMNKTSHNRTKEIYFQPIGLGASHGGSHTSKTDSQIRTLTDILIQEGHTNVTIDYLKFDIEFMEWEVIKDMFKGAHSYRLKGRNSHKSKGENYLQNIKQIVFEMHLREPFVETDKPIGMEDFLDKYAVLKLMENAGFRKFGYRVNPFCYYKSEITGEQRSTCYDLFYLNMKFVKEEHVRKGRGNKNLNNLA